MATLVGRLQAKGLIEQRGRQLSATVQSVGNSTRSCAVNDVDSLFALGIQPHDTVILDFVQNLSSSDDDEVLSLGDEVGLVEISNTLENNLQTDDGNKEIIPTEQVGGNKSPSLHSISTMAEDVFNGLVFGRPLKDIPPRLMSQRHVGVPNFIGQTFRCIVKTHVEGVFRISASVNKLQECRELVDMGKDVNWYADGNVHVAASLIKQFLRDMPETIFTNDLQSTFGAIGILDCPDEEFKNAMLRELINVLPKENRGLLQFVIDRCVKLLQFEEQTKMSAENLATMLAPNMSSGNVQDGSRITALVYHLLTNYQSGSSVFDDAFQEASNNSLIFAIAKAQFDYESKDDEDLTLKCNDIVFLLEPIGNDDEWARGCVVLPSNGQIAYGAFPMNYVTKLTKSADQKHISLEERVFILEQRVSQLTAALTEETRQRMRT